jgi:hypothetical protein
MLLQRVARALAWRLALSLDPSGGAAVVSARSQRGMMWGVLSLALPAASMRLSLEQNARESPAHPLASVQVLSPG